MVLAFGLQALVSLVLSIAAKLLEKPRTLDDLSKSAAEDTWALAVVRQLIEAVGSGDSLSTSAKKSLLQAREHIKNDFNTNPTAISEGNDFLFGDGNSKGAINHNSTIAPLKEVIQYKRKQQSICNILLLASDAQTLTGT